MKHTLVSLDFSAFPDEILTFIGKAQVFDSSCSETSRVYYVDKDGGMYLKVASEQALKPEYLMTEYCHGIGLAAEVLQYSSTAEHDYLLTRAVPGDDCASQKYLNDPRRLCDTIAELLREVHDKKVTGCPITDRISPYARWIVEGYEIGHYEPDLFEGLYCFNTKEEAWKAAREGLKAVNTEVLMHGDYCLPNIILRNWNFSGFVDLINGGMGDRHIDVLWGIWTLKYNLGTTQYTDRFLDAYGRDSVNLDKLRSVAAMEMFGG